MQKISHAAAVALTFTIGFCLLFWQDFPLLHDFPEWMYQSWIFQQLLSGGNAAISANFSIVSHPIPNSLSQIAMAGLNFFVTPVVAGKLWLGVYLALSCLLWVLIGRRNEDAYQPLLLTALITLGPGFWNGYINFQFALVLFALYIYLTVYCNNHSGWLKFLFSLLIYFSHASVFAVFVVFCVAHTLFSANKRSQLQRLLPIVPSMIMMVWYATVQLSATQGHESSSMSLLQWAQYKAYTLAKQGPFHNYILHNGESFLEHHDLIYKVGFVVNFLVAGVLVCWFVFLLYQFVFKTHRKIRQAESNYTGVVVIIIAFCTIAFLIFGVNSFGVVNLGERFLITMLMVVLMLFSAPPLARQVLAGLCLIFVLLSVVATVRLSMLPIHSYTVASSSANETIEQYVDDIYANSRHKYFNHRVFIYADRGQQLLQSEPQLLPIDLQTSIVAPVR